MTVYGRSRNPGRVDPGVLGDILLYEMLADSPLVLWRGYDDGGTDLSGNGRTGTVGASITTASNLAGLKAAYGFPGSATDAGNVMAVDASWQSPQASASGKLTLEAVIHPTSSSEQTVWFKGANNAWEYWLCVELTGKLTLTVWQSGGSAVMVASSSTGLISTDTTYHVAGTFNRSTPSAVVYINGSSVGSSGSASSTSSDGSGALRFGVRKDGGTDRSFTGSMSYGAVYKTDLSSARILAHAQAAGLA